MAETERRLAESERGRPPQRRSNLKSRINYFESGGNEKKTEPQKEEILEVKEEVKEVTGKRSLL